MKEELQGKLVEILTSIQAAVGRASGFAMEQLPDIAQSYVVYGRAWSVAAMTFWLVGLVCGLLLLRWSKNVKDDGADGFFQFMGGMGGGAMALFSAWLLVVSANGAFLVWFAPKVWLLKEIATLLK